MGRVAGKVAFITGAARGQGRSHAIKLAEEGADIIAVDLCDEVACVRYPMPGPEDLEETARLVEKTGQRIVTQQADVRERAQLVSALDAGLAAFGKVDVVIANAGISAMLGEPPLQAWCDTIDINLVGLFNTVHVALPHLQAGASIIATGSTTAQMDTSKNDNPGENLGGVAYTLSKKQLSAYIHQLALHMAPRSIRANVVHPTNCNTDMVHNEAVYKLFRPDLENPTREDAEPALAHMNAMPVPFIEPEDLSNAVLFLASDESRYVTGMQLRVDAGHYLKLYDYHV